LRPSWRSAGKQKNCEKVIKTGRESCPRNLVIGKAASLWPGHKPMLNVQNAENFLNIPEYKRDFTEPETPGKKKIDKLRTKVQGCDRLSEISEGAFENYENFAQLVVKPSIRKSPGEARQKRKKKKGIRREFFRGHQKRPLTWKTPLIEKKKGNTERKKMIRPVVAPEEKSQGIELFHTGTPFDSIRKVEVEQYKEERKGNLRGSTRENFQRGRSGGFSKRKLRQPLRKTRWGKT